MITAAQARSISQEKTDKQLQQDVEMVEAAIVDASKAGERSVTVKPMAFVTAAMVTLAGFKVECKKDDNGKPLKDVIKW